MENNKNELQVVAKPTDLIRNITNEYDLIQLKILDRCFQEIQKENKFDLKNRECKVDIDKVYTIPMQEMINMLYDESNKNSLLSNKTHYIEIIKNKVEKMTIGKFMPIKDVPGDIELVRIFDDIRTSKDKSFINFTIHKTFLPYYNSARKNITYMNLLCEMKIKSLYSFKLYQIFSSWKGYPKFKTSFELLKHQLNIGEKQVCQQYKYFNKMILTPSIKEINEKTELEIENISDIKRGMNVEDLIFTIKVDKNVENQYKDLIMEKDKIIKESFDELVDVENVIEVEETQEVEKKEKPKKEKPKREWVGENPPKEEEVEKYIKDNDLNANAKDFLNYWNSVNWTCKDGSKVLNWKNKLRTSSQFNDKNGVDRRSKIVVGTFKNNKFEKKDNLASEKEKLEEEIKRVKDTMARYEKDNNTDSIIYQNCKRGIVQLEEKLKGM